jgi:maltooligosyltrehalose trehalohydrolase
MPLRTLETWPHGAIMLDAEHTRFALWAPDAFFVSVELEQWTILADCCLRPMAGS